MIVNYIEPANDTVIVVDLPETATIDGLDLPDNVRQQDLVRGVVAFVGPLVTERTTPGDQVLYGPYAGKPAVMNGQQFRLLREGQIEAYVRQREESNEREANDVCRVEGEAGVSTADPTTAELS